MGTKKKKTRPFKELAKQYHDKGLSVIPVRNDMKAPCVKKWSKYCNEIPTVKERKKWKEQFTDAGISVCCGKASGVIAFDLDLYTKTNPLHKKIYNKIKKYIPESPVVRKGKKGKAVFLKYNGEESMQVRANDGTVAFEILSGGRHVIIPPSIHCETKKKYKWTTEDDLLSFPVDELPILDLKDVKKMEKIIKEIEPSENFSSPSSGRNNKLKQMVTAGIKKGKGDKEIRDEIYKFDKNHHSTPLFSDKSEPQMKNKKPRANALAFVKNIRKSVGGESVKNKALNFITLSDLMKKEDKEPEWVVENILAQDGFSILAAKPKIGKTTVAKQLITCVVQGNSFLNRKVKQGKCLFLALEDSERELKNHFNLLGLKKSEWKDILIIFDQAHDPGCKMLKKTIQEQSPSLVVIDTLFKYIPESDSNDYGKMSKALSPLIAVARKTNTHILCVHHAKKGMGFDEDSMLGSTAILGAVDTAIFINKQNGKRFISSRQRYGTEIKESVLKFDEDTKTSSLGLLKEESTKIHVSRNIIDHLDSSTRPLTETELRSVW